MQFLGELQFVVSNAMSWKYGELQRPEKKKERNDGIVGLLIIHRAGDLLCSAAGSCEIFSPLTIWSGWSAS